MCCEKIGTMTRVLIAATDAALCSALKLVLHQRFPVAVVGQRGDQPGLRLALAELQPDLLLIDWASAEFCHSEQLAAYGGMAPHMHIVALSVPSEEIADVLAGGAHACLARGAAPHALFSLLHSYVA